MPRHPTYRKGNKAATFPTKKERKKSYHESRLTSGYTSPDKYFTAICLVKALKKRPIVLAKIKDNLDLTFTIIVYCLNEANTMELWEVLFQNGITEARLYKKKDDYSHLLIQHTYLSLANSLAKDPTAPPLVVPGIMFRPLIELEL